MRKFQAQIGASLGIIQAFRPICRAFFPWHAPCNSLVRHSPGAVHPSRTPHLFLAAYLEHPHSPQLSLLPPEVPLRRQKASSYTAAEASSRPVHGGSVNPTLVARAAGFLPAARGSTGFLKWGRLPACPTLRGFGVHVMICGTTTPVRWQLNLDVAKNLGVVCLRSWQAFTLKRKDVTHMPTLHRTFAGFCHCQHSGTLFAICSLGPNLSCHCPLYPNKRTPTLHSEPRSLPA